MPAAKIAAIAERRAAGDRDEGGSVEISTRTSMYSAAKMSGIETDIRSHNSRVYL